MKQNKKGFTLIELLAVIVILGVIAVIAVPIVKNITKDAKMKSFMNSARGIIRAGDLYYSRKDMMGEVNGDITFEFPNGADDLELNGKLPEAGKMIINADGNIALAIANGKYCITKSFSDKDFAITDDYSECVIPGSGIEIVSTLSALATTSAEVTSIPACLNDGTECTLGTPVAIKVNASDVYNFYVINETDNEVTLIMDRNIYSSTDLNNGNVAWISEEDYGCGVAGDECSLNDKGPLTAIRTLNERTSSWTNIPEREYTYIDDDEKSYEDFTVTSRARMLTRTETISEAIGCTQVTGSCPEWLVTTPVDDEDNGGYWLSAAYEPDLPILAYYIHYSALVSFISVYDVSEIGVRPVITLTK